MTIEITKLFRGVGERMNLMVRILVFVALVSVFCSAQENPNFNPQEVWVKGRLMDHSWRDGRIWVPSGQLQPLLNRSFEFKDVDLVKALEEKGGYIWSFKDGKFEAKPDPSLYSQDFDPNAHARAAGAAIKQERERSIADAAAPGKLYYTVAKFVADTGYVRAYVRVYNQGPNLNNPTKMVCEFTDAFGRPYAVDEIIIPQLEAGKPKTFEVFSMTKFEDTSITPTNKDVSCYFLDLVDPRNNPYSRIEIFKQARERKY